MVQRSLPPIRSLDPDGESTDDVVWKDAEVTGRAYPYPPLVTVETPRPPVRKGPKEFLRGPPKKWGLLQLGEKKLGYEFRAAEQGEVVFRQSKLLPNFYQTAQ